MIVGRTHNAQSRVMISYSARWFCLLLFGSLYVTPTISKPIPEDCQELWFVQRLDHFRWVQLAEASSAQPTFQQRYFVCNAHWKREANGPIFFYAGNEGPLEGYMHNTGLMFENAPQFGALIVFAEHRYYGKTQPFGPESWSKDPSYLTSEQAMADYAILLHNLTVTWQATESPIIAFGGSYGGMLAAWMRRAYPHIIAGAVAASAPVGQFPGVKDFEPSRFWDVVTADATAAAGAAPDCADNVRAAFKQTFELGSTPDGRQQLQQAFLLCDALEDEQQVTALAYWLQGAFDAYAMGNYHFPSDYMTGQGKDLPAWPMRAACKELTNLPAPSATHVTAKATGMAAVTTATARRLLGFGQRQQDNHADAVVAGAANAAGLADTALLVKMRKAVALLYNATGDASCFTLDILGPGAASTGPWDYQVCTEFLGQELPYFPAGPSSMFWDQGPFDWEAVVQHCQSAWGVTPTKYWSAVEHGGTNWRGTSNIVFSNGLLDPWSAFGVLSDVSDSVVAVLIPDGAHHSDLMYSRPDDSAGLAAARQAIMGHVKQWISQYAMQQAGTA